MLLLSVLFFKQTTAYEQRIRDWSSGVCSSYLPVAMRYLDSIDLGLIKGFRDLANMIETILMADRMHAVAQRHVLDIEFGSGGEAGHSAALRARSSTRRSAVLSAADVMMSRLPAEAGR